MAIETKRLQRGNYIQCLFVIGEVVEIYETKVLCRLPGGKIDIYEDKRLNYIKITPDWLEKCWFKRGSETRDLNVFYSTGIHKIEIQITLNGGVLITNKHVILPVQIEYVHQLQNLYLALTGNQLQFRN